jgi:hypothetical protein
LSPASEILAWLDDAAAEKAQADLALAAALQLAPPRLSVGEIVAAVEHCGGLAGVLDQATFVERCALRSDRDQCGVQPRGQRDPTRGRPRCFNGVSEGGLSARRDSIDSQGLVGSDTPGSIM